MEGWTNVGGGGGDNSPYVFHNYTYLIFLTSRMVGLLVIKPVSQLVTPALNMDGLVSGLISLSRRATMTLSLFLSLFHYLSLFLSLSLSFFLSLSVSLFLPLCFCLSLSLSFSLSIYDFFPTAISRLYW